MPSYSPSLRSLIPVHGFSRDSMICSSFPRSGFSLKSQTYFFKWEFYLYYVTITRDTMFINAQSRLLTPHPPLYGLPVSFMNTLLFSHQILQIFSVFVSSFHIQFYYLAWPSSSIEIPSRATELSCLDMNSVLSNHLSYCDQTNY